MSTYAADEPIKLGLWEIHGQPQLLLYGQPLPLPQGPWRVCIRSREQLINHLRQPQVLNGRAQCQSQVVENKGGHIAVRMQCQGQVGALSGLGEVNFSGDQMQGQLNMQGHGPQQLGQLTLNAQVNGQRLGDCR
ncbi:hypothetical protein BFW38_17005 [Terasakiispira papahanaumokuakeensis]|uniref:DUF3617 domain-containing protein n=1 Tax=Terasakiispira papahanaumokuakeensis TaxID=197479 RepID=A0A1E2VDC8_9GAMM|nr:DUF3617 family protein [Terasakiispira papahanaumokuakeensis]ODC04981.1 hypothetical protein BFW38_17005 [Terasakiispira papahanaumokuakeensis]